MLLHCFNAPSLLPCPNFPSAPPFFTQAACKFKTDAALQQTSDATLLAEAARLNFLLGQHAMSIALYDRLLELQGEVSGLALAAQSHCDLGHLRSQQQAQDANRLAAFHYKQCAVLESNRTGAWLAAGNAYERMGEDGGGAAAVEDEIESCYRNAVASDSSSSKAAVTLGNHLAQTGTLPPAAMASFWKRAVATGALHHELQRPTMLVPDLRTSAWHDAVGTESRVARSLRKHFLAIKHEVAAALESGVLERESIADTEGLIATGTWKELNLFHSGRMHEKNCAILPRTAAVLRQLPEVVSMVHGAAKVSVVGPNSHIKPHNGPTNARVRLHLGLIVEQSSNREENDIATVAMASRTESKTDEKTVEPSSWIRVGNETRTWEEGDILAFDDSFEHEVTHVSSSGSKRVVLIVDIWHPDLTEKKRAQLLAKHTGTAQEWRKTVYDDTRAAQTTRFRSWFNTSLDKDLPEV
jgi:aspartyl/asparaginyl beta-hydroxylase (cupin superfamily)